MPSGAVFYYLIEQGFHLYGATPAVDRLDELDLMLADSVNELRTAVRYSPLDFGAFFSRASRPVAASPAGRPGSSPAAEEEGPGESEETAGYVSRKPEGITGASDIVQAALDVRGLHYVAYYGDPNTSCTADVFRHPALGQFFRGPTADQRRDMSPRAKSLLAAWASFDDPVTTVLVVVISSMVLTGADGAAAGTASYAQTLVGNLVFLLAAAVVWVLLGRRAAAGGARRAVQIAALVALLAVVATWQFLMLGLALSALFFRPSLGRWIGRLTNLALFVATFLVGVLLARGIDLRVGIVLGCATFAAQMVVSAAVSWGFSRRDRVSLCLSQQNGITAIILALLLQPLLPDAVAVAAPAILVVNVLHLTSTSLLDLSQGRTGRVPGAPAATDPDNAGAAPDSTPGTETAVGAPPLKQTG
ncbi:hypothetical protein ABZ707_26615 [Streptomyces sp. NPDC006923]|uniref:hypothetical protein n=1 Tax=Streptomyces sp. NPDC006923 TaxID=3155355 RepID=UPI0033C8ADDB